MHHDVATGKVAAGGVAVARRDGERVTSSRIAIVDCINGECDLLMVSQPYDSHKLNVIPVDYQVAHFVGAE